MNSIPPPDDNYPEVIEQVIEAVLHHGADAGRSALEPIAYARQEISKRPGLSRAIQAEVFQRDRFICCYCGARLIPAPIMELISELYPDDFPFHPNWKRGQTHPAILSRSPIVDHVEPGASGGDWHDLDNLVTACWPCNGRKADFTMKQLDWSLRPLPVDEEWDGLTRHYPALWQAAGEPKRDYHLSWMKAFGLAQVSPSDRLNQARRMEP